MKKNSKQKKRTTQYKQSRNNPKYSKRLPTQKKQLVQEKKPTLFRSLVQIISIPSKSIHFIVATFAVVLGFLFNAFSEMPLFWLKGLFGFVLYIILTNTIIYVERKNKELELELTGDPQLVKCQTNYAKHINSNLNFVLCFIASIYFVAISIVLGFVNISPIGIYSLLALFFVVFCAFIVFQYYISILILLHDISNIKPGSYYELIPERTEWFSLLETFSNICRNIFIVLGSLFILLFMLFSPVNSIQIIFQDKFSSPKFLPLLCTWIIILIAIVSMVPFSSIIRSILLIKIHNNLVSQSIENYNNLFKISEGDIKLAYMNIIFNLNDRKYILRHSYSWVIPIIVSITNFTSLVVSILVDLKDLNILT